MASKILSTEWLPTKVFFKAFVTAKIEFYILIDKIFSTVIVQNVLVCMYPVIKREKEIFLALAN